LELIWHIKNASMKYTNKQEEAVSQEVVNMPDINCCENDSKGLQIFPENHNIVNGLCQSLRNATDYRLRILEQIKKQLERISIWKHF